MKQAKDATLAEMEKYLIDNGFPGPEFHDSRLIAIHYFACDWHSGILSNLYAAICKIDYFPNRTDFCDEDECVHEMYRVLENNLTS